MQAEIGLGRRALLKFGALSGALAAVGYAPASSGAPLPQAAEREFLAAWIRPRRGGGLALSFAARRGGAEWRTVANEIELPALQPDSGRSHVVPSFAERTRAVARARDVLIRHAAAMWGVPQGSCTVQKGCVVDPASGRRAALKVWITV